MTTLLVTLASVPTYFAVGLFYARSQAVRIHEEVTKRLSYIPSRIPGELRFQLIPRVLFWWAFLLVDTGGRALAGVVMAPVHERRQRAEKLRADIEHWRTVAAEEVNDEKQGMAHELVRLLTEQLKGLDQ
jgi:hypothetical protein